MPLLELDDALALLETVVPAVTEHEHCPLELALYRVTATAITAPYALPPYTNTAVDGYAIRHDPDITTLPVIGASFAGQPYTGGLLQPGQAIRIATGAVLPQGADTVVMQEDCVAQDGSITIRTLPAPGANIRPAGMDIAQGAIAVARGERLLPQHIALLGALGFTHVPVLRRLRIAIASTGHELRRVGEPLEHGQIIDTNSLMLKQLLASLPATVTQLPALPDQYDATARALRQAAAQHDLLLTTGGVSVGDKDFMREVMHKEGIIHFWKLALRPGKPVMVGQVGQCVVAGLPGNPVSAFVTYLLVVRPLLETLCGKKPSLPAGFPVMLGEALHKPAQLRCFPRARLVTEASGVSAIPYSDQSSNLFTSLTAADGLLDLPTGQADYARGETVLFRPFSGLLG